MVNNVNEKLIYGRIQWVVLYRIALYFCAQCRFIGAHGNSAQGADLSLQGAPMNRHFAPDKLALKQL